MKSTELDSVHLNFSEGDLLFLNLALALIMFGVALNLSWKDFHYLFSHPKSLLLGIFSQFLALPFLTFLLILAISPPPSVALGMFLVAACPGGNVSNFLTALAKGNTALSVSLTAFSTASAIFFTPLNFALWARMYSPTSQLLQQIQLNVWDVFVSITLILGIPLTLGMVTRKIKPTWADGASKVLQPVSLVIFSGFIIMAFIGNFDLFIQYIGVIFLWVLAHNFLGLCAGYLTGTLAKIPLTDVKTLTIETGIQNSGLGLVLIFTYFQGLGGMAILAAWWGIWHLISGLTLAFLWKNYT